MEKLQLNIGATQLQPACIRVRKSSVATAGKMSKHAVLNEVMFHSSSHLCGVREHGGGLLHEVKVTIGGGEAPTVHGMKSSFSKAAHCQQDRTKNTNTSGDVRQAT